MSDLARAFTRVAVVQLDFLPAALSHRRSPLEDPLFRPGEPDGLAPQGEPLSRELAKQLKALRARIRATYVRQLQLRIEAVVRAAQRWNVELLLFPEYAVPWELLKPLSRLAPEMVVVAGSHAVEPAAIRERVYGALDWHEKVRRGEAVSPVLHHGLIKHMQGKLHTSRFEDQLTSSQTWGLASVGGLGPFGTLICLDFLERQSERFTTLAADELRRARFLVAPSLTPLHTVREFASKAQEEAKRYGRPVLYADGAAGGGSTVFADEGRMSELFGFPDRVGVLEAGEEGLLVADVDLGFERAGRSTRYDNQPPVRAVALANFTYEARAVEAPYIQWLKGLAQDLGADDDDDALDRVLDAVEVSEDMLLDAGSVPRARARERRMQTLVHERDGITTMAQCRQLLREVVLGPEVLPMLTLRQALARGAADQIAAWTGGAAVDTLVDVQVRLRQYAEPVLNPKAGDWCEEAVVTMGAVVAEVATEREAPPLSVKIQEVMPAGISLRALGKCEVGGWSLDFAPPRAGDFFEVTVRGPSGRDEVVKVHDPEPQQTVVVRGPEGHEEVSVETRFARFSIDDLELITKSEGGTPNQFQAVLPHHWNFTALIVSWPDRRELWAEDAHGLPELIAALRGAMLPDLEPEPRIFDRAAIEASVEGLRACVEGAKAHIDRLLQERLRDVDGHFIDLELQVHGSHEVIGGLDALDAWLTSSEQVGLLLGEFGRGKSTLLTKWAQRCWDQGRSPRPVLVSLAQAGSRDGPERLLLDAAGLEVSPEHAAALELLIRFGHVVPVFDGFDEMATRVTPSELPGRLQALIATAHDNKVLISSRDSYFRSERSLAQSLTQAVEGALGSAAGVRRWLVQPLSDLKIAELVRSVRAQDADAAIDRIAHTYPLHELADRPLLLGMLLKTLDDLDPSAQVTRARVYEAYLERWLAQTAVGEPDMFSNESKLIFAEDLAAKLWRTGASSCDVSELERDVTRLPIPEEQPLGAAYLEIEAGAFFARDGEGRFRFAHKSFQELFFARYLKRELVRRPTEALDTHLITSEVITFLADLLAPDVRGAACVAQLRNWLITGRTSSGRPLEETQRAARNAFLVLDGLRRSADDDANWLPERADLRQVDFRRFDLTDAVLDAARLEGANFARCTLVRTRFAQADLRSAHLDGAELNDADLQGANLEGASFVYTDIRGGAWQGAQWARAEIDQVVVAPEAALEVAYEAQVAATMAAVPALHPSLPRHHRGSVWSMVCSAHGHRLASAGADGTVRLWDLKAGTPIATLEGHRCSVDALAFALDGRRLASADEDGTVRLWDAEFGTRTSILEGHIGGVSALAFAPDGQRLASAGADGTVRLWDAEFGTCTSILEGHIGSVSALAFAPDGQRLASAGADGTVRLWAPEPGILTASLKGHIGSVRALAFAPDGQRLASAGAAGTVRLWDPQACTSIATLEGHKNEINTLAFAPAGDRLASAGADGTVRLWAPQEGTPIATLEGHKNEIPTLVFTPDGDRLASAGADGTVRLWDPQAGTPIATLEGHKNEINALAFSPDSDRLASAGADGTVRLWDLHHGTPIATLRGHEYPVGALAFAADGECLASAGADGTVRLWDAKTSSPITTFGVDDPVSALVFDGERLTSTTRSGWATYEKGQPVISVRSGAATASAIAPDGRLVLADGESGMLKLYTRGLEYNPKHTTTTLKGHEGYIDVLAFAPDGQLIASGGDGGVRLWDLKEGTLIATYEGFEGYEGLINALAFAPDGQRLAAAGDDGTVRLWDSQAGTLIATLDAHKGRVLALAFAPDGRRLASAGDDGTVRLWDPEAATWLVALEYQGKSWLSRTPGGYFNCFTPISLMLEVPASDGITRYLPARTIAPILHRPDKVRAALAGDLSGDDPAEAFTEAGFAAPRPWDGKPFPLSSGPIEVVTPNVPVERHNPFRPGQLWPASEVPPGRSDLARELLARLADGGSARIEGPRRAGKSSLLGHLAHRLKADEVPVRHLSLQGVAYGTPDDLARALEPSLVADPEPSRTLQSNLRKHSGPHRPVFIVDEVGCLSHSEVQHTPNVFGWLRELGQSLAVLVYAGTTDDWRKVMAHDAKVPGSSFGNDLIGFEVERLDEGIATDMLVEGLKTVSSQHASRAAGWVLERTGPWPYYVQLLGYLLVEQARAGHRRAFTDEAALHEVFEEALRGDLHRVLHGRWVDLPNLARRALLREPGHTPPITQFTLPEREALRVARLYEDGLGWRIALDLPFLLWIKRRQGQLKDELQSRIAEETP